MKCVSFNVNSIRTRLHQLDAVVKKYDPDFIGLQETKVTDEDFPLEVIEDLGYYVEYFGQKTHYGVALLSRTPFQSCIKGFENDDADSQRRFIAGEFQLDNGSTISILNGYFPQGESRDHPIKFPNKRNFYSGLHQHLVKNHDPQKPLIMMGDMNVAPHDDDIGIGEQNHKRWLKSGKSSFLPEEREWFETMMSWGLFDTYRKCIPENREEYSWFDYRSRGFERDPKRGIRIDFILGSLALNSNCTAAGIDYDIRAMERSSDHCPVWAEFDL